MHVRQRSAQMRLERLNRFACPLALTIVACERNRCEASILPRMFRNSFLARRAACTALLGLYICMQSVPSLVRWIVGCTWRIGSSFSRPELPDGVRYQGHALEQQLLNVFNHGFHNTKNGHVANYAHDIAESCCAPTCLFSEVARKSKCDTTVLCASRCEYVLA